MAEEEPIVQTLTLEGGETVISDYQKLGEAGVKAFDDIYEAAERANKQVDEAAEAGKKFGGSLRDAASAAGSFVSSIAKIGGGIGGLVAGYVAATKAIIAHNAAQNNSQNSTKLLTQQVKAQEQGLTDSKVAAVSNARAFQDLNDAMARGEITSADYLKKSTALQLQQQHAAEDQAKVARIQQQATEDRLKEVAALQKQAQAQEEYNALVSKFGAPLTNALENIGRALGDVFEDFKRTFGPAAAELVNHIADAIRNNADTIHSLFQTMADSLKPFTEDGGKRVQSMVTGIVSALRVAVVFITSVVIPAFEGILTVLDGAAAVINKIFGTEFTGAGIAAVIVLGSVTGAFKAVYTAGLAIVNLGTLLSKTPWGAAFTALIIVIGLVIEHFGGLEATWKALQDVWGAVTGKLKDLGNDFLTWFQNTWAGQIIETIKGLIDWFSKLGRAQDDTTSGQKLQVDPNDLAGATPVPRTFAGGGHVIGPGSSTSDSIPAWLSNNEWVMKAAAVRKYGTRFMSLINNLSINPNVLMGLASGGLASLAPATAPQRFSMGGAVRPFAGASGRPFNLIIGNEVFKDLVAPEHTADRLVQWSITKKSHSAGKRQSWVGGAQ
jgi:hypothetical protein